MPAKHTLSQLKTVAFCLSASFISLGSALAGNTYNPDKPSPSVLLPHAPSHVCGEPILTVAEDIDDTRALFAVQCQGADHYSITPTVTVAGEVSTLGQSPYLINATYAVRPDAAGGSVSPPSLASGQMRASAVSVSALSELIAGKLAWDGANNLLSIEERPGKWRVFSVNHLSANPEPGLIDEGLVSRPVVNGQSVSAIAFDHTVSRFAPKPVFSTAKVASKSVPSVFVQVATRNGKLEIQQDATLAANKERIQHAIDRLDRNGADVQRAWALAAMSRYLNRPDEVRYAEHKVAAHNPHLLEQFQQDVRQILPLTLPR